MYSSQYMVWLSKTTWKNGPGDPTSKTAGMMQYSRSLQMRFGSGFSNDPHRIESTPNIRQQFGEKLTQIFKCYL